MQDQDKPSGMGSEGLLFFLWDHRKVITIVTLLGLIGSAIVSYMIDEKFKSTVIIYPTKSNSISKALLSEIPGSTNDILLYGDEVQSEQLLQILNSNRMIDDVNEKFDLFSVYELPEGKAHRDSYMRLIFKDHVRSEPTRYGSIEIEVLDKDPQRAADMANYMCDQLDVIKREMLWSRAEKGLRMVEKQRDILEEEITTLNDSLRILRNLGVLEFERQSERYTEQLGLAIVQGQDRAIREFESRFDTLSKYGGAYITLQSQLYHSISRYTHMCKMFARAKADLESDLPHKFVVDHAHPADKKSYPIRWMVVVIGGLASFMFSVFLVIFMKNINKLKARNGAT